MAERGAGRGVLAGGLAAGVLDILAAFAVYRARGVSPTRILQSISSGLLGGAAFQGGASTAVLGLALHFFIATVAAWVYYLASIRIPRVAGRPGVFGALYGIVVYVFMTFVVLPLSAVPKRPFSLELAATMLLVHIACVGLPIAFAIHRYTRSARQ
jgi:uncharacterized membrane protein YagU involved in acid resistance